MGYSQALYPVVLPGVSNLLASQGHTRRRIVLGNTLNTLQHTITKKNLIMF